MERGLVLLLTNEHRISVWNDGKVLEWIEVIVVQQCAEVYT